MVPSPPHPPHQGDLPLSPVVGRAGAPFREALAASPNPPEVKQTVHEVLARHDEAAVRSTIKSAASVAAVKPATARHAPRGRERRPVTRRRTRSSAGSDDPDPGEPPRRGGDPRYFLADGAAICCPLCEQPLHERDGAHCGGCRLTLWEGVR